MKRKAYALMLLLALTGLASLWGADLHFPLDSLDNLPAKAQSLLLDKDSFAPGVVGNGASLTGHESVTVMLPADFGASPLTLAGYFRPDHFPHGSLATIASFFHNPRCHAHTCLRATRLEHPNCGNSIKRSLNVALSC